MRVSDWSSDVCSSDLVDLGAVDDRDRHGAFDLGTLQARTGDLDAVEGGGVGRGFLVLVLGECDSCAGEGGAGREREQDRITEPVGLPDQDRKSVVSGKRVSVRVDLGGRRIIKKKKK